jgi:hypothetical protein
LAKVLAIEPEKFVCIAYALLRGHSQLFLAKGYVMQERPTVFISATTADGLLFLAFGIVKGAQFRHLERQALDYRALAEALRVQIYWMAAGISESVAASYLQQMRSEMSWIRQAVRAV